MFKRLLLAGAVLASSWLGAAEAQLSSQPNRPADAVNVAEFDFAQWPPVNKVNGQTCAVLGGQYGGGFLSSNGTAPKSPSTVLREVKDTGSGQGGHAFFCSFPGQRKVYFALWTKFDAGSKGLASNNNKVNGYISQGAAGYHFVLPFLYVGGGESGVIPSSFQLRATFNGMKNVTNGSGDNCHLLGKGLVGRSDECNGIVFSLAPNVGSGTVQNDGAWHRLAGIMDLGTCTYSRLDCRDGILQMWIDGAQTHDYRNINYHPELFTEVAWSHTWDGQDAGQPNPAAWETDHYVVAGFGSTTPLEQCRDGIDNDGDGKIDYPDDPGCFNELDNFEGDDPPTQTPGQISLNPSSVSASVVAGGSAQVNINLSKTGTNQNTWSPSSSTAWITTNPPLGGSNTITTETDVLTVTLSAAGKSAGQYTGNITIQETGNNINNTLVIPVTMNVVSEQSVELDKTSFSKCSGNCSTINLQHTISDKPDRAAYITVDWFSSNPASITYARINGVDATLVDSHTNSNCPYYCNTQIWRLKNPPVGTYTVSVAASPAVPLVVNVASFYNVHQTTSEGTPVKTGASGTAPSVTLSSAANEKIIGTFSIRDAGGTITPGSGVTFISNQQDGAGFIRGVAGYRNGGASVQFNASYPPSGGYSILAVPIKPSAVVTPPPPVDPPPSSPVITSVVGSTVNFTHDGLDLAGFKIYFSATSGASKVDVGLSLATSARSFVYQSGCYQLSAYDIGGNESGLSAEMCSSAPPVAGVANLKTSSSSSLRVVDWKGRAWELRGTKLPYKLYVDGGCGTCDVIGYSLRYNTKLKTVEVEFMPGRWIRRDVSIDDWVVLPERDFTSSADAVKALVTGTFTHDGVGAAGFNVYRSDVVGQTKVKLFGVGALERSFTDTKNTFGCYVVASFDSSQKEGPRSNESCTDASPTGPLDVGQISALKVFDFTGRAWELMGAGPPYALYKNGVLEGTIVGYSLRYRSGVVEVEDLPGHWIRRDEKLGDWVVVAP